MHRAQGCVSIVGAAGFKLSMYSITPLLQLAQLVKSTYHTYCRHKVTTTELATVTGVSHEAV